MQKCPKCNMVLAAHHKRCPNCNYQLTPEDTPKKKRVVKVKSK